MNASSVILIGAAFLLMGVTQAVTDFALEEWRRRRTDKRGADK